MNVCDTETENQDKLKWGQQKPGLGKGTDVRKMIDAKEGCLCPEMDKDLREEEF